MDRLRAVDGGQSMKQKLSMLIPALLAPLVLHTSVMAADAAEYRAALTQAENTLCDASGKIQLWSTSDILLADAAEAAASGDYERAVNLANEARLHAELAVATAEREKTTWQRSVPKIQP